MRSSLLLLTSLSLALHSTAVRGDAGCKLHLMTKPAVESGSSVEIELPVTRNLFATIIDTTDGTLGPIFSGHELTDPAILLRICEEAGISIESGSNPAALRWRSLGFNQQKMLLNRINRHLDKKPISFFSNRVIPGLVARSGRIKNYPLESYVEYRGDKDLLDWMGVELHLRSDRLPSQNLVDARRFTQDLMGIDTDVHIHLTAKSRWNAHTAQELKAILQHVDFLRRTEMIAHMISLVDSKIAIARNVDGSVINMGVLSRGDLRTILEKFLLTAKTTAENPKNFVPTSVHSKNYVGFRSEGAYSDPNLWGIEFRAVTAQGNANNFQTLMDAIQTAMYDGRYGAADSDILPWLEREFKRYTEAATTNFSRKNKKRTLVDRILRWMRNGDQLNDLEERYLVHSFATDRLYHYITDQYPMIELRERTGKSSLGESTYGAIYGRFSGDEGSERDLWQTYLKTNARRLGDVNGSNWVNFWNGSNRQLSYVIHSWENDALIVGKTESIEKIRRARLHALRELNRGTPSVLAAREFLIRSGIYEIYLESFGVRPSIPEL